MGAKGNKSLIESFPTDASFAEAFESLFENASDAIYILDKHGKFVAVNREAEELTGFKREDWIGKSFRKIIPARSLPKAIRGFLNVIRGKSISLELELKTAFEKEVLVEVTSKPLIINGKMVGTLGIARDITQRKQLEKALGESEEKYRKQFEEALDAILVADAETGTIVDCNRAASELVGRDKSELVGRHQRILHPPQEIKGKFSRTFKEHLKQKEGQVLETRVITKKGEIKDVAVKANLFELRGKKLIQGIFRDITERKKTGKVLKASEEKYRSIVELAPDCIVTVDLKGRITACNTTTARHSGYSKDELVGKHFSKLGFFQAKDLPKYLKMFYSVIRGKVAEPFEVYCYRRDGTPRLEVHVSLMKKNGKTTGFQAIARDITERKKVERVLRESEEKYRSLMEEAPIGICNVDIRGKITYVNKRFEEVSGYSREEVVGKNGFKLGMFSNETLKLLAKRIKERLMGKPAHLLEIRFKCKDGRWIWVEMDARVAKKLGAPVGFQITARDITERKRAEEALRESEEKYRGIIELAPMAIITMDLKGVITSCNTFMTLSGYSKDEIIGKRFSDIGWLRMRDLPKYLKMFSSIMRGKVPEPFEIRYHHRDGEPHVGEVYTSLMRKKGKIIGIQSAMMDITERKKKERAIRENKEKFERLFMNNPEAAVYMDSGFHILDLNPRFTKLFGYSLDEIKGKHINNVVVPEDKMEEAGMLCKKSRKEYFSYDTARKKKDGCLVPVSISAAPIIVEDQLIGYIGLYKDITERRLMQKKLQEYSEHLEELVEKRTRQLKEAQEQLLKSERLAAIGEMAAMVGHDLRNPLTGIAGATYYLKTKLESKMDKTAKDMVELIEKDIKYSDKIISDLLGYSREIHLELTETTPKSITKYALTSIKVPKNIRILNLADGKPKIKIDVQKMKRVLVNITKNAIDAMPKGGKLTITSKKTNSKLEIAFTDTGTGIRKDILEKIWTPLFTTKAKGMGLGLPICKRIVEAHGGNISVESIVGKGTTFTVTIPVRPKLEGGEKIWVNVPESLLSTTTKA